MNNSSSVMRAGRSADGAPDLHEVECTAPRCSAKPDPEAPAPLCTQHIRLVFAYQLSLATTVSDEAGEFVPTPRPPRPEPALPVVDTRQGWVYFIRKDGLVKIGWSGKLAQRFQQLRPDSVLATVRGTMQDEHRHHRSFAHLREHGEWFRPEPDLLAYIDGLRAA